MRRWTDSQVARLADATLVASLAVMSGLAPDAVAQRRVAGTGFQAPTAVRQPALSIVVIEGEGAVNIIDKKTAVAPVVEVRDRNDQPVAGAVVVFTIRGARAASFAGGSPTVTVTTNATGRAVAAALNPLSSGGLQIQVQATFQGQIAAATIAQTNVATAAAAAASGAASTSGAGAGAGGGAGGGLSGAAIGGIVAGAAGGAAVAAKAASGGGTSTPGTPAPTLAAVVASPAAGIQSVSLIAFSTQSNSQATPTFSWDFGDGGTSTASTPTHLYTATGSFTVRATVTNANGSSSSQTTVTIKSMTGRWILGTTSNFYDLTQNGTNITGTFVAGSFSTAVAGTLQTTSPRVSFSETTIRAGASSVITFTGDPSADANQVVGLLNGGGFPTNTAAGLTRQ